VTIYLHVAQFSGRHTTQWHKPKFFRRASRHNQCRIKVARGV